MCKDKNEAIRLDMANELTLLSNAMLFFSERFYSIGEGLSPCDNSGLNREICLLACNMQLISKDIGKLSSGFMHEGSDVNLAIRIGLVNRLFPYFRFYKDEKGGRYQGDNERVFNGDARL